MDEDGELRGLKEAINNFLWTHLPSTTTIGEAEIIACDLYESIKKVFQEKSV